MPRASALPQQSVPTPLTTTRLCSTTQRALKSLEFALPRWTTSGIAYLPFAQMQLLTIRRQRLQSLHKLIYGAAIGFPERTPTPAAGHGRVHRRGRIPSQRPPSYRGWRRLDLDVVSHSGVQPRTKLRVSQTHSHTHTHTHTACPPVCAFNY